MFTLIVPRAAALTDRTERRIELHVVVAVMPVYADSLDPLIPSDPPSYINHPEYWAIRYTTQERLHLCMSYSPMATPTIRFEPHSEGVAVIESQETIRDILNALNTSDCRRILDATSTEALSASEVSDACGLPLSTTYRKLDLLTDAGLLEERTRIRLSGHHTSEYLHVVKDVTISVARNGEMELLVSRRDHPALHVSSIS